MMFAFVVAFVAVAWRVDVVHAQEVSRAVARARARRRK